jgi:lipopolysaccharide transport system permease protein
MTVSADRPVRGAVESSAAPARATTISARNRASLIAYLRELLRFRDLFYFLVRRDIKVRYAQTVLGFGWAILQPFSQMVVFSIFFGGLAGVSSGGVPYPVFSIAAVVPWTYFANAVLAGSTSLIGSAGIVSKVYFPRLLVPLAPVGAGIVDLLIGIGLLLAVMAAFGIVPTTAAIVATPVLALAAALAAAALGVWLSVLAVQYRDVRYITPFVLQLMLFVTPVIYVVASVPEWIRPFYSINPMVGVIGGFRSAFLGIGPMPYSSIATSFVVSSILLITGLLYFRRVERVFADIA